MNKVADRKELTLEVESGSDEKNKPLVTKPSLDNSFQLEQMYVLEVRLSNTYSKVAELINNFAWQPLKELSGRKKQACQTKKQDSTKFDDNLITFID